MLLLAISGSLREASSNTRIIEALPLLAPAGVTVERYAALGELPFFNADLDDDRLPGRVAQFRKLVGRAAGLIICSPEYAHGVSGVMKNALDWLVPSVEFPGKPVALINASATARHAQAHIRETLTVMTARIVEAASITAALRAADLTPRQIAGDPELGPRLREALGVFVEAIRAMPSVRF
jgi:NAD(P)H-dependent FMN reductase